MSEYSASLARDQFSDLISKAAYGKERVVLTRRGKRLVAIVSIEDYDLIESLEETEDIRDAEAAHTRILQGEERPIPLDEAMKVLGWDNLSNPGGRLQDSLYHSGSAVVDYGAEGG